jgi:Gram-negative bacterial TonB protein C-terminal
LGLVSSAPSFVKMYYRVPQLKPANLPRLRPPGPGGRPGWGSLPNRLPRLASTVSHPNIMLNSKPAHPDNFRQTIYQPSSPPELRIAAEQKIPNLVWGHPLENPKAPLIPNPARPMNTSRKFSPAAAPSVRADPSSSLMTFLRPSDTKPRLAVPLATPVERINRGAGNSSGEASADAAGLVLLGVDPAGTTGQFSLPQGNRWGEFSIARPGGGDGSMGGDPNGTPGGGTGNGGSGGDESTGLGTGGSGGGGGKSGLVVSGSEDHGALEAALASGRIFPVAPPPLNVRRNTLVISAGPIGGGGLKVYGVLHCGKIYSIFLPMPGKNWSMQYCDKFASTQNASPSDRSATVVQLQNYLRPPDVKLDHRFDFQRVPVPLEKSNRLIVLKGVIAADGTVQRLTVYEGVLPEMDEAARIAFGRWQFRPAMRGGKPVEVEILVGIPPSGRED